MSRRREAFTLIEIMFALIAGLIAISVVYSLNTGTTRLLAEQNRIAGTQTSVRLAMEQIRADIERAGFLSSPNSAGERVCGTPSYTVQAIEFTSGTFTGNVPNASAHGVRADRLRLTGNYVTSGGYYADIGSSNGGSVKFQTTWQSFRRDFGTPDGTLNMAVDADAFARAFSDGRMVRIETRQLHYVYSTVTGRTVGPSAPAPNVYITLGTPISFDGLCISGLEVGAMVTPINRIEYGILNPRTNAAVGALVAAGTGAGTTNLVEGIPSVLARYEIDSAGTPIANTYRIVLENAVEFSLSFDVDTTSGPDAAPTIRVNQANYGSSPQQVRAVRVRLSARTSDAEPGHPYIARATDAPLTRYYARDDQIAGAAGAPSSRVRTLTSIVFVPNLAYADMP